LEAQELHQSRNHKAATKMAVHQRRIHKDNNADTNDLQVLMHRGAQKQREGIMKA
jgi:hypothetical protein